MSKAFPLTPRGEPKALPMVSGEEGEGVFFLMEWGGAGDWTQGLTENFRRLSSGLHTGQVPRNLAVQEHITAATALHNQRKESGPHHLFISYRLTLSWRWGNGRKRMLGYADKTMQLENATVRIFC
jgi:hypothetical protein